MNTAQNLREPLLTPREAADRLNVSIWTVRAMTRDGRLAAVRLGDGPLARIRVTPAAVDQLLANAKEPA
jgi:excisionase family DNA binding protein